MSSLVILALLFSLTIRLSIIVILFHPWRIKRLAYWLMLKSEWYKSWVISLVLTRMTDRNEKIALAMASIPKSSKYATQRMINFREALMTEYNTQ